MSAAFTKEGLERGELAEDLEGWIGQAVGAGTGIRTLVIGRDL